jgi:hypothetical protein
MPKDDGHAVFVGAGAGLTKSLPQPPPRRSARMDVGERHARCDTWLRNRSRVVVPGAVRGLVEPGVVVHLWRRDDQLRVRQVAHSKVLHGAGGLLRQIQGAQVVIDPRSR